jgi:pimeloyl-ACP methyl ester carboxylesterase
LNYYGNLDRNRELLEAYRGAQGVVPALYLVGAGDAGLCIPGMQQSMAIPDACHWLQQEAPDEVTAALLGFLQAL